MPEEPILKTAKKQLKREWIVSGRPEHGLEERQRRHHGINKVPELEPRPSLAASPRLHICLPPCIDLFPHHAKHHAREHRQIEQQVAPQRLLPPFSRAS